MSIFDKFLETRGWVRKEKTAVPAVSGSYSANPFTLWASQKKIDPAKALEVFTGWVYASSRAIGMEIGSIDFELFKTGKKTDERIFEHELLDILSAVNNYQTNFEFFYLVAIYLEMTGNAPIYLDGCKSDLDKPTALHLFIPPKLKVLADREEFPPRIQGFRYTLGSKIYNFQPYQVLQLKYPDPSDPYEGIGTVQSIGQWVDADNYAMEYNRRFFLNGARVGGFLESDSSLDTDQQEYLKTSFEAAFVGVENAYRVLALPKGVKYEEGGKTQKDLDFSNMMTIMRDRIIAGFRVPRTALGITDDVNRANAEATDYVFAARTIKPIMKFVTGYLNEFLVPRYGENLYLKFKDPVPEDRAQETEERKASLGGAPWKSVNEVREEEGDDPIEGGDEVQIPFSLTPIGAPKPTDPNAAKEINKKENKPTKTRFAMNAERRRSVTKSIAEKAASAISDVFKEISEIKSKGQKDLMNLSDDEYEKIYKGFAIRVTKFERMQMDAVQKLNAKQKQEVIGNLPKITKAINKKDLFDREAGINVLVDLSSPILYDLAAKEGKEAAALLGLGEINILTPEVRRALDRGIELMSRSYNDTTLDLLKGKLEQGLKEGLSQSEMAGLINNVYDYSDEVRALATARTETFRIANYSTQEAWRQSGIVKTQIWFTAADERVCPWCSPQHGKVISIDDNFYSKGDTVTGSDGSTLDVNYSDVGAPPLHVSCRCYIRPGEISLE